MHTYGNNAIVAEYDYYTLDQAKAILMEEYREKIEERKQKKRQRKLQILKQRIQGVFLVIIGLLLMRLFYIVAQDGTVGLFFIIPGLALVINKKPLYN